MAVVVAATVFNALLLEKTWGVGFIGITAGNSSKDTSLVCQTYVKLRSYQ